MRIRSRFQIFVLVSLLAAGAFCVSALSAFDIQFRGERVPPEFQNAPTQREQFEPAAPQAAPVLRTTYNRWLTAFFSAAVLNDPSQESTQWGRAADPDKDGAPNELEYFAGTSPVVPSAPLVPQLAFTTIGGDKFALVSFPLRKALSDPNRVVEIRAGDDLRALAPVNATLVSAGVQDSANPIEIVSYRLPAPVNNQRSLIVSATITALLVDSDADGLADAIENGSHAFLGAHSPGTDANAADTDADGIKDGDETLGTFANLNLPEMGCNPVRRNILLEYDWFDDALECTAHSHRPSQGAMDRLATAFAAAPIVNPDGTLGITVIQDRGSGGAFIGGNLVSNQDSAANLVGGVSGAAFYEHKSVNFAANRHGYFHYVLLPHRYNTNSSSSGQAEVNGDDLIVSLYCSGSDLNVANTIMHELGHNLGLRHGGNTNCNYKPNYNSVMNYRYQFPGVDTNCTIPGNGVLDYSRGLRLTLNETALDENAGICGTTPVDFNNNGVIESNISVDLNSSDLDQANSCGGTLTILTDYNDWAQIFFGGVGDSDGARVELVEVIECDNPAPL
ncbi:MAG TPA: hypothetical protein VF683_07170 [Chthoniobacterales bacterium]